MLPVHVLPTAGWVVVDYLVAALADRDEPYAAGVRVAEYASPTAMPFVQVRVIGGTQATPAHDNPRVDFIVWHSTEDKRRDLAKLCRALTRAASGDATSSGRITFDDEFMAPRIMPDPVDGTREVVMFTHSFFVR